MNSTAPEAHLVPIREVAKITGLNPITIRAWERRYDLVEPIRTESGHRLYTPEHIVTLQEAVKLTQQGIPISQIKALLPEPKVAIPAQNDDIRQPLIQQVEKQDSTQLNQLLESLLADFPDSFWIAALLKTDFALRDAATTQRNFWESLLLPRLYSRLYLAQRSQTSRRPLIWVQAQTQRERVLQILAALQINLGGGRAFITSETLTPDDNAMKQLQANHCKGLAAASFAPDFHARAWQKWSQAHPSFQCHLFAHPALKPLDESHSLSVTFFDQE
ncbi:MAG: MerR family transcriptional regulator [Hydrogenovibrio sp.]